MKSKRRPATVGYIVRHEKTVRFFFACLIFVIVSATASSVFAQQNLPRDIRWVRQSVEYAALCKQTYFAAWQAVKAKATTMQSDWAVVLDIDETVLDNSQYQVEIFTRGESFSYASWDEWVEREQAKAIPGVKAFLDSVRAIDAKAHIVFITNRDAKLEQATISNLKALGLWGAGDVLMGRRERADSKEIRRQEVRTGTGRCEGFGEREIIALVGDQIGDFFEPKEGGAFDALKTEVLQHSDFGLRFFMLPNPMYGAWERGDEE